MSSEAINGPPNGASYDQNSSDQDEHRRRKDVEIYRPGAYFNEEREKLRRRAHFGERRLEDNNGGSHNQRSNGRSRGRGRGSGNRGGKNFNSYRNKTRDEEEFDDSSNAENAEPEFIPTVDPLQVSPPPIGNWADEIDVMVFLIFFKIKSGRTVAISNYYILGAA